jgi:hypothetical protein
MRPLQLVRHILSTLFSQDTEFFRQCLATGLTVNPGNHVCVKCGNCQAGNPPRKVQSSRFKVQGREQGQAQTFHQLQVGQRYLKNYLDKFHKTHLIAAPLAYDGPILNFS